MSGLSPKALTARSYRRQGYTYAAIGRLMGVSGEWARALCVDGERKRLDMKSKAWLNSGTCPECGGAMTRPQHGLYLGRPKPYERCRACHARRVSEAAFARKVVGETLLCCICHERKPFAQFPPGLLAKYLERRKGASPRCSACDSAARRLYRERHKVPCIQCGEPRLVEGGGRGILTGLCRPCFLNRKRSAA